MDRREFLKRCVGTAAAVALKPVASVVAAPAPVHPAVLFLTEPEGTFRLEYMSEPWNLPGPSWTSLLAERFRIPGADMMPPDLPAEAD